MDKPFQGVSDQALLDEYSRRFKIAKGAPFNNAQQVARHLRGLLGGTRRETFVALYLTRKNVLIDSEILFEGTVNQSAVFPREVARSALLKDASSVTDTTFSSDLMVRLWVSREVSSMLK